MFKLLKTLSQSQARPGKLKIILSLLVLLTVFVFLKLPPIGSWGENSYVVGALYNYDYTSYSFDDAPWNPSAEDPGECSDSVDNDGDGLTDFDDFGCFGPNFQETATDYGWTLFEPEGTTRIVYVSNSAGNDSNDGLSSTTPVKTLAAGVALLRDDQGDWLLLKRGDTWTNETFGNWAKDGKSSTQPLLISSYGTATTRPVVKVGSSSPLSSNNSGYIAIKGLYLYAHTRDYEGGEFNNTDGTSFKFLAQGNLTYIHLEDNRISNIYTSIENNVAGATTTDVRIRRNVIHDSYTTNCTVSSGTCDHSQGLFMTGLDEILIEENVFDHNGWNDDFLLAIDTTTTTLATWQAVTDGVFKIILEDTTFQVTGLNFSTIASLGDAATVLTNGINTALAAVPDARRATTTYLGSQFLITSSGFFNEANGHSSYSVNTSTEAGTQIANVLIDAGGLNPSATVFNHSMYITQNGGNIIIRGNIVSRSSSHGTQLRAGYGGLIDDNLYIQNSVTFFTGNGPSIARNNVVLGAKNATPDLPRGWGINPQNQTDTVFENNILTHNTSTISSGYHAISLGNVDTGIQRVTIRDNFIYDWKTRSSGNGMIDFPDAFGLSDDITIANNVIYDSIGGWPLVSIRKTILDANKVTFTNNSYYSVDGNPNDNFSLPGQSSTSSTGFFSLSGETGTYGPISLPDPDRDLDSYMVSIGASPATWDNFYAQAKLQSRFNWQTEYTAEAVNDYIRAGFGTSDIVAPTLTTDAATAVGQTTATLNATITITGGEDDATQSGFVYGTDSTLTSGTATTTLGAQSGLVSFSDDLTGLTCGTIYYFKAYATNSAGTGYGSIANFTPTGCDTTAPARSAGSPAASQDAGTTSVTLSATTDEAATCKYSTTANTAYASMTNTFSTTGGTAHSTTISGLTDGNSYNYYIRCQDGSSNANSSDYAVSFSVASAGGGATSVIDRTVSSGGGGSTRNISPDGPVEVGTINTQGINLLVQVDSQVAFSVLSTTGVLENHTLKVSHLNLTVEEVTLVFQSDPVTVVLQAGDVKEVDLDNDGLNDLKVTFNQLNLNQADLTINNIQGLSKLKDLNLNINDLIKIAANPAVYYLANDGKKHLFVNEVTFWTWYDGDWSDFAYNHVTTTVKTVAQQDFDQLASGAHLTVKPATKLIKFTNSPRVYAVTPGALLREVVNTAGLNAVAKALYGQDYQQNVITIQSGFENDYLKGNALTVNSDKPEETLEIWELWE